MAPIKFNAKFQYIDLLPANTVNDVRNLLLDQCGQYPWWKSVSSTWMHLIIIMTIWYDIALVVHSI